MTGGQQHWNTVYGARPEDELTWFEAMPAVSLELVRAHLQPGEPFIDIGAGASRLVDALLEEGFGPITVLDLSAAALAVSRQRLGPNAEDVAWIEADITTWKPDRDYAVWHDRAVFHFLTDAEDRRLRPRPARCPTPGQNRDHRNVRRRRARDVLRPARGPLCAGGAGA
jgi:SAM-dependent methyltransferase